MEAWPTEVLGDVAASMITACRSCSLFVRNLCPMVTFMRPPGVAGINLSYGRVA